jgi:hypothetical protein
MQGLVLVVTCVLGQYAYGDSAYQDRPEAAYQDVQAPRAYPVDPHEGEDCVVRSLINQDVTWFHAMPQTCYSPRFGCYPGNGRDIQRYPAFHGSYYRRPYNYRTLFEYPWYARPHEPRPLAPYCERPEVVASPLPEAAMPAPQPEPSWHPQARQSQVEPTQY